MSWWIAKFQPSYKRVNSISQQRDWNNSQAKKYSTKTITDYHSSIFYKAPFDYCEIVCDQKNHKTYYYLIDKIQYGAAFAITCTIKGTSQIKLSKELGHESLRFSRCFFFNIWVFFHEHSRITGLQGKAEGISLTSRYRFHPLYRHLDISWAITAESSPLHIASSRTRTRNLWFPSVSRRVNRLNGCILTLRLNHEICLYIYMSWFLQDIIFIYLFYFI